MFLDEKQHGEAQTAEQANRKLKLSEAIRIGKTMVVEGMTSHRFCALGCAWAGYNGRAMTLKDLADLRVRGGDWSARIGAALGIPDGIADEISVRHCRGTPALQIADWLQEQGY